MHAANERFPIRVDLRSSAVPSSGPPCLRVWRARDRYQPTAAFRTWLFTIARRLALDELKRRETHPVLLAAETADDEDSVGTVEALAGAEQASPQEIVLARELARRLDR